MPKYLSLSNKISWLTVSRANVSKHQTNRGKPQKNDFAQTLQFGRVISPKNCYAIGFLKYRVIIEKCAIFDDAAEAAILHLCPEMQAMTKMADLAKEFHN